MLLFRTQLSNSKEYLEKYKCRQVRSLTRSEISEQRNYLTWTRCQAYYKKVYNKHWRISNPSDPRIPKISEVPLSVIYPKQSKRCNIEISDVLIAAIRCSQEEIRLCVEIPWCRIKKIKSYSFWDRCGKEYKFD